MQKKHLVGFRIGGVPEHFNLPWRLAIESGSLTSAGVSAHWRNFHSGTGQMVQALANNDIDMATLLTEGAVSALSDSEHAEQFELFSFYTNTPLIWGIHSPAHSSIKSLADIENATFVISRYGSGSHLMAYLLAESLNLDTSNLQFKIVHNLGGARDLFKNGGDYIFLWEKFMTKPYVDNGEMHNIGDFPTPWPCFITCVRKNILQQYPEQVALIMNKVLATANELKTSPIAVKLIASRYRLDVQDVTTWLTATDWHQSINLDPIILKTVKEKLTQLNII